MYDLINEIVGTVIAVVVALAFMPAIIDSATSASQGASSSVATLLGLVPLVFVAGMILVIAYLLFKKH